MYRSLFIVLLLATALYAQTPVYLNITSHNEVTDPIQYDTDSAGFMQSRSYLIELANIVRSKGAKYNFQADWRFLNAVLAFDTGNDPATNGKNVLRWLVEDCGGRIQVDAHSHQSGGYNYADVAELISRCGVPDSKIAGGFLWNDTTGLKSWLLFENGQRGMKFPLKTWKPDIVWGAATKGMFHDGDINAFGSWRPAGAWNLMTHDPAKRVRLQGNACSNLVTDTTTVADNLAKLNEMLAAVATGVLPGGNFYTANIMLNQRDFKPPYIAKIGELIDSLNTLAAGGKIIWATIGEKDSIWRNTYAGQPHFITCDNYLTGVEDGPAPIPERISLEQNYPNPFNPNTVIRYALPVAGNVELNVYNTLGEKVAMLVNGFTPAGVHSVQFDATRFTSGVYFYEIKTDDFKAMRKMVLIK